MVKQLITRVSGVKRYIPTVGFLGGSVWDTLTLKRIDNWVDLAFCAGYLLLGAAMLVIMGRKFWEGTKFYQKVSQYYPAALQFFLGGMFSACTVYYFKSTSGLPAFLFLLGLAGLLVGNEFLEKKYSDIQVGFLLWSICAFMILNFLLPVVLHTMNAAVFVAGVVLALSLCLLVKKLIKPEPLSITPTAATFALLVLLYFLNVIPPVPLSKKSMAIYHSIHRESSFWVCSMERPHWWQPFKEGESVYKYAPGDSVFCYTSVFAPTKLTKRIYHHWFFYDTTQNAYVKRGSMGYTVSGGRDDGFRGFTFKKSLQHGKWKVAVKTEEGKTIGITTFRLVPREPSDSLDLVTVVY